MKKTVTMALETGIYGGSVCLLNNGREVSGWIGRTDQTKSKDFLESIKAVLHDSQFGIREIDEIVISMGPGSYTGLRVGYSIAKGLKAALGINIKGVSLLDGMLKGARPITIAALPFSKTEVCWKVMEYERYNSFWSENPLNFTTYIDFVNVIKSLNADNLILPSKLYEELSEILGISTSEVKIIHCEENLACLLGKLKINFINDEELKIFYPKPFRIE
jgi:tRNA threonylcarbamoyl adenosine modification protein YeaZ